VKIHQTNLEYEHLPTLIGLLDSHIFFWVIVLVTTSVFIWAIAKLWSLHSIPKVLAKEKGFRQGKLVFWLCMLGLIWKPLWILAVMAVVIDWGAFEDWVRSLRLPPDNTGQSPLQNPSIDQQTEQPISQITNEESDS